jgi:hypothetical protein
MAEARAERCRHDPESARRRSPARLPRRRSRAPRSLPMRCIALLPGPVHRVDDRRVLTRRSANQLFVGQRRRSECDRYWQYKATVRLRETGGVDTTVTNIHPQALVGSNILATARVNPMISVLANSSSDAGLVFAADKHVEDLSALTVGVTVHFRDAHGNTGSAAQSSMPSPVSAAGTTRPSSHLENEVSGSPRGEAARVTKAASPAEP